jgi:hypothetical protein
MIVHGRGIDYEKHCKYAFGSYIQANDDPKIKNSNSPRTLDCIYLRYSDNIQGGHELLHLPTNHIIVRQYVTQVPISPAIIKQEHQIVETEEMPNGLMIKNRVNNVIYDHARIAGVDYENDAPFNDKPDNDDDNNNDDGEYDEMDPDEIEGLAYNPTKINQEQHELDDDQEE